jgi:hypothetical protein
MTASASAGSLVGKEAEGVTDRVVDLVAQIELDVPVSLAEPSLLRRVRERIASARLSREHRRGRRCSRSIGNRRRGHRRNRRGAVQLLESVLSMRAVSFPPGADLRASF